MSNEQRIHKIIWFAKQLAGLSLEEVLKHFNIQIAENWSSWDTETQLDMRFIYEGTARVLFPQAKVTLEI